ncbi:uncharacterized protein LOC143785111 [Ranitomeya variabilis]|uniref:uncharacterized protein LOC143785111 n=1 Tax=Ranitomeya variabilis TaxID=490064 RepID=UPI004057419F
MAHSSSKCLTDQEIEAIMFQSDDESELSLSDEEYLPPDNQTSSSSDSSDDEEVNLVDPQEVISRTSKTNVFWDSNPTLVGRTPTHNIVRQAQGAVRSPSYFTPKDVFCTYFSDNIAEEVLLCSNLEGRRIASAKNKSWKNISKEELYAYIGLLLLAGSQKSYDVPIRELFLDPLSDPHYKATMSVGRYEEIRRIIRFDDKRTRAARFETDKLAPISYIWNIFIKNCTKLYNPSTNVTVDEQLVPFRGRCKFIQYMPSKPAKYGIKIFWMCDSANYYGINGVIYCGKEVGAPVQKDLGSEIVKTLAVPIFNSGRNITMDNYFTSVELGNFLLAKAITLAGTIKQNRREIPEALKHNRQRALYESVFGFNNKATLVSYKAKKEKSVILLKGQPGVRYHDKVRDKSSIVSHHSQKRSSLFLGDRLRPILDCLHFIHLWLYFVPSDDVAQVFCLFFPHGILTWVYVKPCLPPCIQYHLDLLQITSSIWSEDHNVIQKLCSLSSFNTRTMGLDRPLFDSSMTPRLNVLHASFYMAWLQASGIR